MRAELERAEEMNRNYVTFTTDSVMREVVRYYDRHGSANERLKAHYLLGCVYRDLHEAPIALLTWEEAIACADTTAADCDYATLFRVYGQMADIYFRQYLPEKQLEAQKQLCHYALLAGDTLYYLRGCLRYNDIYYVLGDTTSVFQNTEQVRNEFNKQGMFQEAAQVYPAAIAIALDHNSLERARFMMDIYENQSGMFDDNGNIKPTHEKYYYRKGQYFLGTHQTDSAERQFRRLLEFDVMKVDGYQGLLAVFDQRRNADSVYKYARLYEQALVKYLKDTKTEAITQAEGMYDYTRQSRIAQDQLRKTHQRDIILILIVSFFCFIALTTYLYIQRERKEKERIITEQTRNYDRALKNWEKAKKEKAQLKEALVNKEVAVNLLTEKAEQVQQLEALVKDLQAQICTSPGIIVSQQIEESDIMKLFHQIAHSHFEGTEAFRNKIEARAADDDEWEELVEAIRLCHPCFYLFIKEHKLSPLKSKVCILARFGFDNQEIATLAGVHIGSVTNARTRVAKELFGLDSARDLDSRLRTI